MDRFLRARAAAPVTTTSVNVAKSRDPKSIIPELLLGFNIYDFFRLA